jgi:hypothetical protein
VALAAHSAVLALTSFRLVLLVLVVVLAHFIFIPEIIFFKGSE